MSNLSKDALHDDQFDRIRAIISEHFPNFCFIVMDDDGDLYYDYTNVRIGKMLMREAEEDMSSNLFDVFDFNEVDIEEEDAE